jgi:hypothetical protein
MKYLSSIIFVILITQSISAQFKANPKDETYLLGFNELSTISDSIQTLKVQRLKVNNLEHRLDLIMDSESNYNQALIKLKLRDSISTLEIYNLNKINSELRSKSTACEEAISNQSLLLDLRQKEVYDLNKKILKKTKFNNFFKVFTPALAVVTGLLLIKS